VVSDVTVRPITPDQHDAVMHFFDLVAYADNPNWAKCYCCERLVEDYSERTREQNRALRSDLIRSAKANGLVAYRLGRVVGWCHAAPKSELPLLASWDPNNATETRIGAVVCFVVAPDARRHGVATELLDKAVDYLRERGMTAIEAYPPLVSPDDPALWPRRNYHGPLSMYLKAGFHEVSRNESAITVRREL
jgi:GNAT superfamily N-acetyltransferase